MLIAKFTSWARARFTAPALQAETPRPMAVTTTTSEAPAVADRPQSAVEILRNEPNLDAATLAARAGVTMSYARSLIRRRRAKTAVAPARAVTPDGSVALLQSQVRELSRRLDHTDDCIVRPPATLSRRTQVLDRQAAGIASKRIAEELAMPVGEVDFILKIDRLKKSLKN